MNLNARIDREVRSHCLWCWINGLVCGIAVVTVCLNWGKLFGG